MIGMDAKMRIEDVYGDLCRMGAFQYPIVYGDYCIIGGHDSLEGMEGQIEDVCVRHGFRVRFTLSLVVLTWRGA